MLDVGGVCELSLMLVECELSLVCCVGGDVGGV